MADPISQQLAQLLHMFQEERAANLARQEAVAEMNLRLDELTKEFAAYITNPNTAEVSCSHQDRRGEKGSPPRDIRGKNIVGSSSGGANMIPKFSKLNFPHYDGKSDPLGWLSRCEHFFRHQGTPEEDKVSIASFHLEGNAQLWFLQLEIDVPYPSWEDFKHHCHLRFGPPIRSHKLGELAKLQQSSSVAEYQEKFGQLVARAGTLTQAQKIELYISGLADYIAVEVELHDPPDLSTAMSMSRLYERKNLAMQSIRPVLTEDRKLKPPDTPPIQHSRYINRLNRSEMEERRLKGLCFNCDEPFVRGHQCKKLFYIDVIEDVEDDASPSEFPPTNDPLEISLNA